MPRRILLLQPQTFDLVRTRFTGSRSSVRTTRTTLHSQDENNNPIVGIEAFRPLSVSADLAYSYRIGRYLGLSVTARYIRSSYGELFTNNALGFDVAAYARIPLNRMLEGAWVSAGAKISDFGFTFDDSNYDLPTKFSVGGSLFAPIRDSHSLEASVDLATATLPRRTSPSGWASAWSMC